MGESPASRQNQQPVGPLQKTYYGTAMQFDNPIQGQWRTASDPPFLISHSGYTRIPASVAGIPSEVFDSPPTWRKYRPVEIDGEIYISFNAANRLAPEKKLILAPLEALATNYFDEIVAGFAPNFRDEIEAALIASLSNQGVNA